MFANPEETLKRLKLIDSKRHQWISVMAYYKAEFGGFDLGKELDFWLEAEAEYIKLQMETFLLRCKEDGGMSIVELQVLAYKVGVSHPERFNTKIALIHEIQHINQQPRCFKAGNQMLCKQEVECQWRSECQKLVAVWFRHNN